MQQTDKTTTVYERNSTRRRGSDSRTEVVGWCSKVMHCDGMGSEDGECGGRGEERGERNQRGVPRGNDERELAAWELGVALGRGKYRGNKLASKGDRPCTI